MSEKKATYLVPYDFSKESDTALRIALDIAEMDNGCIDLLHLVDSDKEIHDAEMRLREVKARHPFEEQEMINIRVVKGSIFEDIHKVAEYDDADLIIMGTHGAKGMQKLLGSHALKVVSSSDTPFIICQDKAPQKGQINDIVMPFNFEKESVQVVKFAASLAEMFGSTIHLVGFHTKDPIFEKKMKVNQKIIRGHLDEHKVPSKIITLTGKDGEYQKKLIAYSEEIGADMLTMAYFADGLLPQLDTFVQHMITNEHKIPVLTVNAHNLNKASSRLTFITA